MIKKFTTAEEKVLAKWRKNKRRVANLYKPEFQHEDIVPSPSISFDMKGIESKCVMPKNYLNRFHRKIVIAINRGYTEKTLIRTYCHELAHAYRYIDYNYIINDERRAYEEVIAETVVILILGRTDWSFRYVAGWGSSLSQSGFDCALRIASQVALRVYDNWGFHLEHFENVYFRHMQLRNSLEIKLFEQEKSSPNLSVLEEVA